MPSFGISIDGFYRKTREDILNDINADQLANISATLNHATTAVLGQLNGVASDHIAEVWEVLEGDYTAIDPATATGLALDYIALQIGLTRNAAEFTIGTVEFTVSAPVTINIGTKISLASDPDITFLTITAVNAVAPGVYPATVIAYKTGPFIAIAGDVSVLESAISQVTNVTNPLDLITGRDVEDDEDLRARYFAAVAAAGKATKPAIRSAILRTTGVTATKIFNNRNDATNAEGVPGHSVECVVDGGADDDIAQAIGDTVAAHGGFHSSTGDSGTWVSEITGETETIAFSRPTLIDLGFELDIRVNTSEFPVDGDTQIREAMKAYVDSLGLGDDVILSQMNCPILDIYGTVDVFEIRCEAIPTPPIHANFIIGNRERATISDSVANITINYL